MPDYLYIFNSDAMKKFITHLITFTVLFFVIDYIVGMLFVTTEEKIIDRSPSSSTQLDHTINKVKSDILIVGASNASRHYVSSLFEDSLMLSTYNAGRDGLFFYFQTAFINQITNKYSPRIIIWEIRPTFLYATLSEENKEFARLSVLNSYYDRSKYIKDLIKKRSYFEKYKMLCRSYRYNGRIFGYAEAALGFGTKIPNSGYLPLPDSGYEYPSVESRFIESSVSKDRENRFIGTLNICKTKNIQIVIAFSPHLSNDNYNETSQYLRMKEIADSMQIPIIDNYHNQLFMNDSTMFKDNAHLNDRGAHIYTNMFITQLKNRVDLRK